MQRTTKTQRSALDSWRRWPIALALVAVAVTSVVLGFSGPAVTASPDSEVAVLNRYRLDGNSGNRELLRAAVADRLASIPTAATEAAIDSEIDRIAGGLGNSAVTDTLTPWLVAELFEALFEEERTPAQDQFHDWFQGYYAQTQQDIADVTLRAWDNYINPPTDFRPPPSYGPCCTLSILAFGDTGPQLSGFTPPDNAIGIGGLGYAAIDQFVTSAVIASNADFAEAYDLFGVSYPDGTDISQALSSLGFTAAGVTALFGSFAAGIAATNTVVVTVMVEKVVEVVTVAPGVVQAITDLVPELARQLVSASLGTVAAAQSLALSAIVVLPMLIGAGMRIADFANTAKFDETVRHAAANVDYEPDFAAIVGAKTELNAGLYYRPCKPDHDGVATLCYSRECPTGFEVIALNCTALADTIAKRTTDRGAGTVPTECAPGESYEGGLCYPGCPPNSTSDGALYCYSNCPAGWSATVASCGQPIQYWNTYSLLDYAGCAANTGSCTQRGLLYYVDCAAPYVYDSAQTCAIPCPANFTDVGVICERPSFNRGAGGVPTQCAGNRQNESGLCYVPCPAGFSSFVTQCLEDLACPPGYNDTGLTCFRNLSVLPRQAYDRGVGTVLPPSPETVSANKVQILQVLLKAVIADPADYGSIGTTNPPPAPVIEDFADVPPTAPNAILEDTTIVAGETTNLSARIADANLGESHTFTLDWGDTSTVSVVVQDLPGELLETKSYTYNTPGVYTASLTVTDETGLTDTRTATVTVENVDPTISVSTPAAVPEGTATVVEASFTDVGSSAGTTATVDWGQGDGPVAVALADLGALSHVYADDGSYTVTVTVDDGSGGVAQSSVDAVVTNVTPFVSVNTPAVDGLTLSVAGSFIDPGLSDSHTATVDWGDGTPIETVDATDLSALTHTYAGFGGYSVIVTVTDDDGAAGQASTLVSLGPAPSVKVDIVTGAPVEGDVFEIDIESPATLARITWGDGTPPQFVSSFSGITHNYAEAGVYDVAVFIANTDVIPPTFNEITVPVTISNAAPVVVATGDSIVEGDVATISASFTDISANDAHTATVDWGDGTPVENVDIADLGSLSHGYASDGLFTATVSVTDDAGATGTATTTVTVANAAPDVTAMADDGDEGTAVTLAGSFTDAGVADTHVATVDWGEGAGEEPVDVDDIGSLTHVYSDDGTFQITLSIDDGVDVGTAEVDVEIRNVAPVVTSTDTTVAVGAEASILASFIDPGVLDTHRTGIDWGDGDGPVEITSNEVQTLTHVYAEPGNFTVQITVVDDSDARGVTNAAVTVVDAPTLTTSVTSGGVIEGGTASVVVESSAPTASIDWGDGTGTAAFDPSSPDALTHTYADDGVYTVTVTTTDSFGQVATSTDTVTVSNAAPDVTAEGARIGRRQTATIVASFADPGLTDTHTATVDFGDGDGPIAVGAGGLANLTRSYEDAGTYPVTVTVTDSDGLSGTATTSVVVSEEAPDVTLTIDDPTVDEGEAVIAVASFTDPTNGDTHVATVDWGDGSGPIPVELADLSNLTHVYAADGRYDVTVTVTDAASFTDSDTVEVEVGDVEAVVTVTLDADTANEGDTVSLTVAVTDAGVDDTYDVTVDWGDGDGAIAVGPEGLGDLTHVYADDGVYTITVIATPSAARTAALTDGFVQMAAAMSTPAPVTRTITVVGVAPIVSVGNGSPIQATAGQELTVSASFFDPSTADTHMATVDWGDGSGPIGVTPGSLGALTHTFAAEGTFTVTVTVTDDDGLSSSESTTIRVEAAQVGPDTSGDLPTTGSSASPALVWALALLGAGVGALGLSRRRRSAAGVK